MPYIVLFTDNPDHEDQRQIHMQAHLSFLETLGPKMLAAGPLLDEGSGQGGLWLVEADTTDQVEQMIRDDPFYPTGLRQSWRILTWRQVFAAGKRLI